MRPDVFVIDLYADERLDAERDPRDPKALADEDRRKFIASCGTFAVVTPPALTVLLSTSLSSTAIAKSTGGNGNNGNKETTETTGTTEITAAVMAGTTEAPTVKTTVPVEGSDKFGPAPDLEPARGRR